MSIETGPKIEASSGVLDKFSERYFGEKPERIQITPEEKAKYNLLAVGPFSEKNLKVVNETTLVLNEKEKAAQNFVDKYTDKFVDENNKKRQLTGQRPIANWPKLQVIKVEQRDKSCRVKISGEATNYARTLIMGQESGLRRVYEAYHNSTSQDETISFERFKELFQPHMPTAAALIFTSDNRILLAKRHPDKVSVYGEAWHLPAGGVDASDLNIKGAIDPFLTIKREIREEIGIKPDELNNLTCLGITVDPELANVEFLFIASTKLKSTDIVDQGAPSVDQRLKLKPEEIEGDIRPKKIIVEGKLTKILPALLKIDEIFGVNKRHGQPGPELTVPTSRALFFLVNKILTENK